MSWNVVCDLNDLPEFSPKLRGSLLSNICGRRKVEPLPANPDPAVDLIVAQSNIAKAVTLSAAIQETFPETEPNLLINAFCQFLAAAHAVSTLRAIPDDPGEALREYLQHWNRNSQNAPVQCTELRFDQVQTNPDLLFAPYTAIGWATGEAQDLLRALQGLEPRKAHRSLDMHVMLVEGETGKFGTLTLEWFPFSVTEQNPQPAGLIRHPDIFLLPWDARFQAALNNSLTWANEQHWAKHGGEVRWNLTVLHDEEFLPAITGDSLGGAMAVGLYMLWNGLKSDLSLTITASVDREGKLGRVGGVIGKLDEGQKHNLRTVLLASDQPGLASLKQSYGNRSLFLKEYGTVEEAAKYIAEEQQKSRLSADGGRGAFCSRLPYKQLLEMLDVFIDRQSGNEDDWCRHEFGARALQSGTIRCLMVCGPSGRGKTAFMLKMREWLLDQSGSEDCFPWLDTLFALKMNQNSLQGFLDSVIHPKDKTISLEPVYIFIEDADVLLKRQDSISQLLMEIAQQPRFRIVVTSWEQDGGDLMEYLASFQWRNSLKAVNLPAFDYYNVRQFMGELFASKINSSELDRLADYLCPISRTTPPQRAGLEPVDLTYFMQIFGNLKTVAEITDGLNRLYNSRGESIRENIVNTLFQSIRILEADQVVLYKDAMSLGSAIALLTGATADDKLARWFQDFAQPVSSAALYALFGFPEPSCSRWEQAWLDWEQARLNWEEAWLKPATRFLRAHRVLVQRDADNRANFEFFHPSLTLHFYKSLTDPNHKELDSKRQELHRRAAEHYKGQGQYGDAGWHYLQVKDLDNADKCLGPASEDAESHNRYAILNFLRLVYNQSVSPLSPDLWERNKWAMNHAELAHVFYHQTAALPGTSPSALTDAEPTAEKSVLTEEKLYEKAHESATEVYAQFDENAASKTEKHDNRRARLLAGTVMIAVEFELSSTDKRVPTKRPTERLIIDLEEDIRTTSAHYNPALEANNQTLLGILYNRIGMFERAVECYERSEQIWRDLEKSDANFKVHRLDRLRATTCKLRSLLLLGRADEGVKDLDILWNKDPRYRGLRFPGNNQETLSQDFHSPDKAYALVNYMQCVMVTGNVSSLPSAWFPQSPDTSQPWWPLYQPTKTRGSGWQLAARPGPRDERRPAALGDSLPVADEAWIATYIDALVGARLFYEAKFEAAEIVFEYCRLAFERQTETRDEPMMAINAAFCRLYSALFTGGDDEDHHRYAETALEYIIKEAIKIADEPIAFQMVTFLLVKLAGINARYQSPLKLWQAQVGEKLALKRSYLEDLHSKYSDNATSALLSRLIQETVELYDDIADSDRLSGLCDRIEERYHGIINYTPPGSEKTIPFFPVVLMRGALILRPAPITRWNG